MKESVKTFLIAALMLLVSIGTGTIAFATLEGYNLLDAFYMTMLMVSTVGFREVSPLTDSGKLFASFYMMFNLGIYA
ncbi:MAG: potassium channel family protein, partial [Cyclobacteriaceae bacterium]